MALRGNICTKVIRGGVIAMILLSNTLPNFGYDSLRYSNEYFSRFGKDKSKVIAFEYTI